ncbi:calcium/sodium antiporter [Candidatus Uhrbacteria bacterium]|nr:calcium/sodium antiporter [Candidatus Uhrbacteria bacterium]
MTTLFFLVVGFALLIKGAGWLVDGASSIAKRFGISDLAVGLTIVAFGTSAPELIVNTVASISGNTEIAIGNILGSNIANILLILGIAAVIYPLRVTKGTVWKEIPFSLLAVLMIAVMANDQWIDGLEFSALTRTDGIALIGFFAIFLFYTYELAFGGPPSEQGLPVRRFGLLRSVSMVAGGLMVLVVGGKWVVDSAVEIASNLGVSESLIGLTVVAVGTSLPELATSAVAAYKRNVDIAVGNVVGSNIFNIFWILGMSSIIRPLPFQSRSNMDIGVAVLATLLLFIFLFVGKRHIIERWQGTGFLTAYVLYITVLIVRG